jgi:hypothetical protein
MGNDPAVVQVQGLEKQIDLLDADGVFFTAQDEISSDAEEHTEKTM